MAKILPINPFSNFQTALYCLLAVPIFFLSPNLYSQRISIEGKITAGSDVDIEGINIFNLSSSQGTITDAQGGFRIAVAQNDTLSVSAVHIQQTTLIIGEEQMSTKKIIINLSEKMNELATVTLRKPLTGYIATDANIIPTEEPITATSIGLPNADLKKLTLSQRQMYAAKSGPLDILVNALSGRTKMLKKRLEFEKTYQLTLSLIDKFPETFFTDALKIDKFKVYSFIFFCEEDPDYKKTMQGTTMEIIEFLREKSVEFRGKGEVGDER